MMFAARMMRGFATFGGKHRIIATKGSNIIFAKQMHHIAAGDASFDKYMNLWYNIKKGGATMKDNKLVELSMDFSVDIINLVKFLKSNHETIIANQIGRSGTSIGANIHEAQYA